jgi:hypothetical protein
MELHQTSHDPLVTTPHGINFSLVDSEDKVHCSITRAALVFLAGHFLVADDYAEVFEAYRPDIEKAVRRKYRNGHDRTHRLTVNVHDFVASACDLRLSDETPAPSH